MVSSFLSAKWQHLIMINYEIDPAVLTPFIPKGTELDLWNGKAYVSLVGFMFLDTRVKGIAFPCHRNFEEVNLRFYVKRSHSPKEERRGVVFIQEVVPRWGIAKLARVLYNENYVSLPMRHFIDQQPEKTTVEYQWKFNERWQKIRVCCEGLPEYPLKDSEAEFIAEHYWGYTTQHDGGAKEYEVKHPPWRIWDVHDYEISVDAHNLYGPKFAKYLEKKPVSVFLAEGSEVVVFKGMLIQDSQD